MSPDLGTILFDLRVEHDPEPPPPEVVDAWWPCVHARAALRAARWRRERRGSQCGRR